MWKKISAVLIPSLVAAALIVFMLARVWDDLLIAVQHLVPAYLIAAILICLAAWYLRGWRYQYILKRLGTQIGLNFSTACIYVSQTANLIIPARLGDFVRLFILKHEKGTPYTNSFTSVVAERVYDVIIIAVLGLFALPMLISLVPAWFVWMIVFVLGAGA
ncbi:MAG TPA: lysylphosphatidylglycerol synthase transmembrane domain-containing protein, partial [Methanocorpusculum sp.]|nr:lysylphosphatidylglycerol synthase transmembrane domain-containing protein [Methanocorpusculum sp.]